MRRGKKGAGLDLFAGYDRASDWASTRGQAPWQAEGGEGKRPSHQMAGRTYQI